MFVKLKCVFSVMGGKNLYALFPFESSGVGGVVHGRSNQAIQSRKCDASASNAVGELRPIRHIQCPWRLASTRLRSWVRTT